MRPDAYDMQVLEELVGGDVPLRVLVSMGPSFRETMLSLRRHVEVGTVRVLDPEGRVVEGEAWDELCRASLESVDALRGCRATITRRGLDLKWGGRGDGD